MSVYADNALMLAMCDRLPQPGEVFTTGDQERWLDAMRAILAFLYPPEWVPDARRKAKEAQEASVQPYAVRVTMDPDAVRRMTESWGKIGLDSFQPEEELSRTFAGVVDDASGGEEASDSGAGSAPDTSSIPSAGSPLESAPSSPSSGDPVPATDSPSSEPVLGEGVRVVPQPRSPATPFARRHFTADQRGALIRRVVREGLGPVSLDAMIHETTLRRWMREMPVSVQTFTEEWEAEQKAAVIAEGVPTVEELEAEKETPVPSRLTEDMQRRATELAAKPAVQWPTAPIERRPFDPEQARSHQAGQS